MSKKAKPLFVQCPFCHAEMVIEGLRHSDESYKNTEITDYSGHKRWYSTADDPDSEGKIHEVCSLRFRCHKCGWTCFQSDDDRNGTFDTLLLCANLKSISVNLWKLR